MSTATDTALGTHSEVGKLRTVMVHRPDLAHERLSPTNCHELLFDDVIWVRRARQEFDAFTDLMRERGVEVAARSTSCSRRRSRIRLRATGSSRAASVRRT